MKLSSLSIFLPAHNEEENIEHTVDQALSIAPDVAQEFEILIINDGSADKTGQIADELAHLNPKIKVIHHPQNLGYGAALRSGFRASQLDYIFFTDADRQFDLKQIKDLVPFVKEADIVAGYRIKRSDSISRQFNTFLYHLLIQIMFGLKIKDIDCAFKLIKKSVIDNIALDSTGALISAEFLIKAKKKGFKIVQVGVNHYPRLYGKQSGAQFRVIMRMFLELGKFYKELKQTAWTGNINDKVK